MNFKIQFILLFALLFFSCKKPAPVLISYSPDFGPPETLVVVEGENFGTIHTLNFSEGVPANFNPSYGSDIGLLFRVPDDAPIGENIITIATDGGELKLPFRVTLEAPLLLDFYPTSAPLGAEVTILGENFFEPLEILFHDSIAAEIKFRADDSIVVFVPDQATQGFINLKANGGNSLTNKNFTPTKDILISNFDGNGIHNEINDWLFYGNINENTSTAISSVDPESFDGNFLKLSSKETVPIWIGGTEHNSFDVTEFDVYEINSGLNNTFLEFQGNNNGKDKTVISLILRERNGSINDFSANVEIEGTGWNTYSIPLNRFMDLDGLTINPQDIKVVKIHIVNPENKTDDMEINIDNLKFVEVL